MLQVSRQCVLTILLVAKFTSERIQNLRAPRAAVDFASSLNIVHWHKVILRYKVEFGSGRVNREVEAHLRRLQDSDLSIRQAYID